MLVWDWGTEGNWAKPAFDAWWADAHLEDASPEELDWDGCWEPADQFNVWVGSWGAWNWELGKFAPDDQFIVGAENWFDPCDWFCQFEVWVGSWGTENCWFDDGNWTFEGRDEFKYCSYGEVLKLKELWNPGKVGCPEDCVGCWKLILNNLLNKNLILAFFKTINLFILVYFVAWDIF